MQKTKQQQIVKAMLERYTEIDNDCELVALPKYGSNYKVKIGTTKTTLKRWSYYEAYGYFPEHRLRSFSRIKDSLEPSYLFAPAEL